MNSIDWKSVRRVLVIRLRSIGDTVLATPTLAALKDFLPDAEVDVLLEDWVAPLLADSNLVDNVISLEKGSLPRLKTAMDIRQRRYDVVFNLHGGTTGTFFAAASGAAHRVGYSEYQYSFLYNHLLSSASDFWKKKYTHSVEQQLALLGFISVPFHPKQRTRLDVNKTADESLTAKFRSRFGRVPERFALIHPAAAFATKTWGVENFARIAEVAANWVLETVAVATKRERDVLDRLVAGSSVPVITFDDLSLPEITALASRAKLFVGNDSGIAHIAAAVNTPSVVVFGSSNIHHWRPWTEAPNEIVYEPLPCQPCPGYECREFGEPRCILNVSVELAEAAIGRVLEQTKGGL